MNPVVDNRLELGEEPGLHVLIVGLSNYSHLPESEEDPGPLGLTRLSSAALTAHRVYDWLLDRQDHLPLPLSTCRLLLAPSEVELAAEPLLGELTTSCTLDSFLEAAYSWRDDASTNADSMSLFYFAGHGAQRSSLDHVLLLEDFGNGRGGILTNAVDTAELVGGMAPCGSRPFMARRQLYFLDACRISPEEFLQYETVRTTQMWVVERDGEDNRLTPIFYTAVPGAASYGVRGEQSIFSKALLDCLNGGAGERVGYDDYGNATWSVTVGSLIGALEYHIAKANDENGAGQAFEVARVGMGQGLVINNLEEPPDVDVSLTLGPDTAMGHTQVRVWKENDELIWDLPAGNEYPHTDALPAGYYWLRTTIEPPVEGLEGRRAMREASPPFQHWPINVRSIRNTGV